MTNSRYEIKYLITKADAIDLYTKLKFIMCVDEHSDENSQYLVRSIYYDNIYNSAYSSKKNGDNNRTKYRIRAYNMSDNIILFEKKTKSNNKIYKTALELKRYQYEQIIAQNYDILEKMNIPLATEIYGLHLSTNLQPTIMVEYSRMALTHPLSNTRITFDSDLRAAINSLDIFDEDTYTYPIFPNGSIILEIKYDNVLPAHISSILSTIAGEKTSLSKFSMCKDTLSTLNIPKRLTPSLIRL